ncbi:MAG: hypothetical protein ACR2P8_13780 [Myxococcota bacterium]
MSESESGRPIHSALDDDPGASESVDAFVFALAERIDALQDAEARGDLRELRTLVIELGKEALAAGYAPLQRSAEEVARAAGQGHSELAYKALVQLTDVASRVRQGHRGAL